MNLLTPVNDVEILAEQLLQLDLEDKAHRMAAVISLVFEKAVDEPGHAALYAKMVLTFYDFNGLQTHTHTHTHTLFEFSTYLEFNIWYLAPKHL